MDATGWEYFDGHNDVLFRLGMRGAESINEFLEGASSGHIDYPRARKAGFVGGFFALSVPPWAGTSGRAVREELPGGGFAWPYSPQLSREHALKEIEPQINALQKILERSNDRLKLIRRKTDLNSQEDTRIGMVLHLEGADAVQGDLSDFEEWFALGVRSIGVTWSRTNQFGSGVPIRFPSSPNIGDGLTSAGRSLISMCNDRGVIVDVSHLNEAGFWDVIKHSKKPVVATHSNFHALCPSSRNLTDGQAVAIRDSGGLVGISFATHDLRSDGREQPDTDLDVIISHIRYGIDLLGEDHVALGSDFDGTLIPRALVDVTGIQDFLLLLKSHGLSDHTIEKIACKNWKRILAASLPE